MGRAPFETRPIRAELRLSAAAFQHDQKLFLCKHWDAQFRSFLALGACGLPSHHITGLFRYGTRHLSSLGLDKLCSLFPAQVLQRASQDKSFP